MMNVHVQMFRDSNLGPPVTSLEEGGALPESAEWEVTWRLWLNQSNHHILPP